MSKYTVNISKTICKHYTCEIEASSKEQAMEIASKKLENGELSESTNLFFTSEEPDYDVNDDPSAYDVVDASLSEN